jgi:DNA-binding FrmR family transcriptional regulator
MSGTKKRVTRGYSGRKDEVLRRVGRIEGQVRGVRRMIDDEEYCIDVLTQISAATKALESVSLMLLGDHLEHCVADAISSGSADAKDKVAEANAAISRLVRS